MAAFDPLQTLEQTLDQGMALYLIRKLGLKFPDKLAFATLLGSARYSFIGGDVSKTLRLLEEAEEMKPLSPVYRVFKAMALVRSGRRDEGDQLLQTVLQQTASSTDAESKYALTYAQMLQALDSENFELAEVLFDRAKGISVKASVRRALPLLIRPTVEWSRSRPGIAAR